MSKKKWDVFAVFSGTKFCGQVEADTREEAEEKADRIADGPSFCYQCADEAGDSSLDVERVIVEPVE